MERERNTLTNTYTHIFREREEISMLIWNKWAEREREREREKGKKKRTNK
jgi:hypothetical protein